ncbi:hypothetical protein GC175_15535 [bacterium]|nr:hypothetical protein [bacterium]
MQAKQGTLRTVVVVLIASLVLTACNGSNGQGSTWFNLPSIPVTLDAQGNASVLGFSLGYIGLQPSLIAQLQAANVQELEIRIGHNGIFLYQNGQALPYIAWNDQSVETLNSVLRSGALDSYGVPGDTVATALPWARRIGLGVDLRLPLASGATALDIPNWRGETPVTAGGDVATTIGPIAINGLAFDQSGNASIAGTSLSDLGIAFALPANVLQILQQINAEQVSINTSSTGIQLALNGQPLPSIAYNGESLGRALGLAQPFVAGTPMESTLADLGPQLEGADIEVAVSFTGEPVGGIQIASVPLQLQADGRLSAYGIAVTNVGADLVGSLQGAGVEQLFVNIAQDNLILAVNGEALPVITWSPETLALIGDLAPALGLPADMIGSVLPLVQGLLSESPLGLSIAVAPATSAEPVAVDATVPDVAGLPEPDIQIGAVLQNGQLQSVAGLPVSTLSGLGIAIPALPADIVNILNSLGVNQLQIVSSSNVLVVRGDESTLLALTYTDESLGNLLSLVGALTGDTGLIDTVNQYLPLITAQNLNIVVGLNGGEAPATRLTDIPLTVQQDGSLLVYGADLGLGSLLPAETIALLQSADLQQVNLDIQGNSLYLAVNGEALPVISWNVDALDTVQQVVGALVAVSPELLGTVLELLQTTDIGLQVGLPPAQGATAIVVPADFDVTQMQLQAPDLGGIDPPVVQLVLNYENGRLVEAGGIPVEVLAALGLPPLDLPANLNAVLAGQFNQVRLVGSPNMMEIMGGDTTLMTLSYDTATLENTLDVASPFLPAQFSSILSDEGIGALLGQNILPLLTSANVNVTANLE